MKFTDLVRHLQANGCILEREGSGHSIFKNIANGRRASVPRHREIKFPTAMKICKQLEIEKPSKR